MCEGDIVLADVFFKTVNDLLYGSPSGDIGSLKSNELLLIFKYLPLLDYKLRLINVGATVAVLVHPVCLLIGKSLIIMIKMIIIIGSCGTARSVRGIRVLLH
jgi:hypothetical protein